MHATFIVLQENQTPRRLPFFTGRNWIFEDNRNGSFLCWWQKSPNKSGQIFKACLKMLFVELRNEWFWCNFFAYGCLNSLVLGSINIWKLIVPSWITFLMALRANEVEILLDIDGGSGQKNKFSMQSERFC